MTLSFTPSDLALEAVKDVTAGADISTTTDPVLAGLYNIHTKTSGAMLSLGQSARISGKRLKIAGKENETGLYLASCASDGSYDTDPSTWTHLGMEDIVDNTNTKILLAGAVINLLFVIIEAAIGLWQNSLSLLSDAGHNLSDVFSLLLVLIAIRLTHVQQNEHYSYGYKKSSVLISLLNAVLLLVAVGAIVVEAVRKFYHPTPIDGAALSWTAGVGILVNGATAILLMKGQKEDLNIKGAFLHMAADTLVSVGVVISGLIILWTGWTLIDPIMSLVIAAVILFGTWDLLHESLRLSIDAVPEGVDMEEIKAHIMEVPHVKDVHHIHIWALSTTENALTAHIVTDSLKAMHETKCGIKEELKEHGITHATLEFETEQEDCSEQACGKG